MAKRLLRTSVVGMLTVVLLLGGGPAATDAVHADPPASSVAPLESSLNQASEQFELRSTIAFASNRDNNTCGAPVFSLVFRLCLLNSVEIYLMNPDPDPQKQDPRRLTNNGDYDAFPALSPDGKKIVFDSNQPRGGDNPPTHQCPRFPNPNNPNNCTAADHFDLFVMNADGTDRQHLTRGASPTWDSKAKYVAYHASKSGKLGLFKPSPSGAPFDSDIFVLNVDDCRKVMEVTGVKDCRNVPGDHLKDITNSEGQVEDDPNWSPDGTKIVYTRHPEAQNVADNVFAPQAEIWVMRVNPNGTPVQDGTENPKQLTFTNGTSTDRCPAGSTALCPAEERAAAWSADGTRIAFMRRIPGGRSKIWVMNADGTNQVQLTHDALFDASPTWSPDGKKILFAHGETTDTLELYSMKMYPDDPDSTCGTQGGTCIITQLTNTDGFNFTPDWGVLRVHSGGPTVTQPARAPAAAPVPKR